MAEEFKINALGVMSGTSLDGLDLCLVEFRFDGRWQFRIETTDCIEYDRSWREKLSKAHQLSGNQLVELDAEFGRFIADAINDFLVRNSAQTPELVCSHGHTVFHQPEKGITRQIGDGQKISSITGIICVNDFRSLDVELGGQGAPLVPIGDKLLFSEYDACLNLGGFSNISFDENEIRKAFDICPVNIVLNPLANLIGLPYDDKGNIARSGNVVDDLLDGLNALNIYSFSQRPSLAREWVESVFLPIIERKTLTIEDQLRTITEHVAIQIGRVLDDRIGSEQVLVTGGGAYNDFLIGRLKTITSAQIVIPDSQLIDFKEALIFAFLGVLRFRNETNVLRSVTGARQDSCSGVVHLP